MLIRERGSSPTLESYAVVVAGVVFATSCSFEHGKLCATLEQLPVSPLTSQVSNIVLSAADTLQIVHGSGCAEASDGRLIKVEQSLVFPAFVDRATVFINGWNVRYRVSDHHVTSIVATLGKISFQRGKLTWNAVGRLDEEDADEPYRFCYHFSALGWNSANLDAHVDHDDALTFCDDNNASQDNVYWSRNDRADTALASFRSYLQNGAFTPYRSVALLPRGFGIGWADGDDHHLLQLAYNLDHAEPFVQNKTPYQKAQGTIALNLPNAADRVGDGYVSWQTYTIMKDDRARRDFIFGELVSAMAGEDVGVIQPPFAILPQASVSALVGDTSDEDVTIENVPYEFALPMLTGWEIGYGNDQHVKEVGVWIDSFSYQKPTGFPGTLRYKIASRLRDKDSVPGHYRRHKVTILGLRAAPMRATGSPLKSKSP